MYKGNFQRPNLKERCAMIFIEDIGVNSFSSGKDLADSEQRVCVFICPEGAEALIQRTFRIFKISKDIRYEPFCEDFGPMGMLSIMRFIESFDAELLNCAQAKSWRLVYVAEPGTRGFTNAVFLLGCYLILRLNQSPQEVQAKFRYFSTKLFERYRDVTSSSEDFRLSLLDCWQGLARGRCLGWIALPKRAGDHQWGQIDKDMYAHYENPLNADLHEVVPGKFIAFRGPKELKGPLYRDLATGCRDFDAKYYVDVFKDFEVSTVIRLNETQYGSEAFEDNNIRHHDLYFEDCTPPPSQVVKRFLDIVDQAQGCIAVHCKAGLGRTGTMIAIFLMRTYGFSAREAIGWLRIMRPGSVIGLQQHFLCKVDAKMRAQALHGRLPSNPVAARAWQSRATASASHHGSGHVGIPGNEETPLVSHNNNASQTVEHARANFKWSSFSASAPQLTPSGADQGVGVVRQARRERSASIAVEVWAGTVRRDSMRIERDLAENQGDSATEEGLPDRSQ